MRKDESTRTYTSEDLAAMRAGGKSRTDWKKVDSITDEVLEKITADDEYERGLNPDWTKARLLMPESKGHINLRVDRDVLRFFKAQGPGYQTRINAVLRSYMLARQERGG
ncbi:MAG: hypothetical protein HW416_1982 [Chloroflexi bacterium]|nr:hypothetical protein [Chloroflexota bacterium]